MCLDINRCVLLTVTADGRFQLAQNNNITIKILKEDASEATKIMM